MPPKKRGRPKSLLPKNIKENAENKPSKAENMPNKDDQNHSDDGSLKLSKRNLNSQQDFQLELSSTTPVIRRSSRLSSMKPVISPITPSLSSSTQSKRNECKLNAIVNEDDNGECSKSFNKDSLTNSSNEDITPLISDPSVSKNAKEDICRNDTSSVDTENFNHIFGQAIVDENCIDQEIGAKICKDSKSLQRYNISKNSEPSELKVNADSEELNKVGKEKISGNKFNKYKESISGILEIEQKKNSSILTNALEEMRKNKEENMLFSQGSKNNKLPSIDDDNQNSNFEVIEVSEDKSVKNKPIHTIKELEKKYCSKKIKESEMEENEPSEKRNPIVNPLGDQRTLKCRLNEGEIEKPQESKEEILSHDVATLNNKPPFNSNKFGITEIDNGKMVEASNSTDIKAIALNKTSKNPSHVKKSKQIPGISYILIIVIKDASGKKSELQYDCVLCNLSEGKKFVGAAMKAHLRSRSHLLNVLEIENNELYEKYKANTTITDAVLYTNVCECQSSSKKTLVSDPAAYVNKRKILAKTVSRLRKALKPSCEEKYPPSSLVNETDSLQSNIKNTFTSEQEKKSEPLNEDVQGFLKELMLVIGHSWVQHVVAELERVPWLRHWDIKSACAPEATIGELMGMIPQYVTAELSYILLFTTIPEAYKRGVPGMARRIVYPSPDFTAMEHAQQLNEFVCRCKRINPTVRVIVMIPPALDLWFYNHSKVPHFEQALQRLYPGRDYQWTLHDRAVAAYLEIGNLMTGRVQWTDKIYLDIQQVVYNYSHLRPDVTRFLKGETYTLGRAGYLADGVHPSPEFVLKIWEYVFSSGLLKGPFSLSRHHLSSAQRNVDEREDLPREKNWKKRSRQEYRERRTIQRRADARRRVQSRGTSPEGTEGGRSYSSGWDKRTRDSRDRTDTEMEVVLHSPGPSGETGTRPRHPTIRAPSPDKSEVVASESKRQRRPGLGRSRETVVEDTDVTEGSTLMEEVVVRGVISTSKMVEEYVPSPVGLLDRPLMAGSLPSAAERMEFCADFIHSHMERMVGLILGYSMGHGHQNITPEDIFRYLADYCINRVNNPQDR